MSFGEASLIHVTHELDDINQTVDKETPIKIPVEVKSIGRAEWNAAGQQGLTPSMTLVTSSINYNKEEIVEYESERYAIYRTFVRDDGKIELYLKKEAGI